MFTRGNRGSGRHARDESARGGTARDRAARRAQDSQGTAGDPASDEAVAGAQAGETDTADQTTATDGPYDVADAPPARRLDLGALQLPQVPGVEVRVQANQQGVIQQVYLVHGESALQLGAFAAPRSESIWDEVRAELTESLTSDGARVHERAGEYGTELCAQVRTKQGAVRDLRFVGVEGPRWLVRAVFQGPAAADPAAAGPLADCLRGLVVDRGGEARPVREPLPLRLSAEMAQQVQRRSEGGAVSSAGATGEGFARPNGAGAGPHAAGPAG